MTIHCIDEYVLKNEWAKAIRTIKASNQNDGSMLRTCESAFATLCRAQFTAGMLQLEDRGQANPLAEKKLQDDGCVFARFLIELHNSIRSKIDQPYPSILLSRQEHGRGSPLHLLLRGLAKPSMPLLQTMLSYCVSHPTADHQPTYKDLLTDTNKWGSTPLHLISECPCSSELHSTLLAPVKVDPSMLLVQNDDGLTPLHTALVKEFHRYRFFGKTFVECRLSLFLRYDNMELLHAIPDKMGQSPLESFLIDNEPDTCNGQEFVWSYLESVLRVSMPHAISQLHAVAALANCRSASLAKLCLNFYPGQAQQQRDSDGMLPLHVACSCPYPRSDLPSIEDSPLPWDQVLSTILKAHPDAARVRCKREKRLPLHYLLAFRGTRDQTFLNQLVAADRSAVSEVDPISGLYCFQLAAQVESLETIYVLLRCDPSLLRVSWLEMTVSSLTEGTTY